MLNNKNILITGGTGSFGMRFVDIVLRRYRPKKVIVFSRDEFKQSQMAKKYPSAIDDPKSKYPIRYFLGDVRDVNRLITAFRGVDYVIHAAALKQVPSLEYNPSEAIKTNILGTENVVDAALYNKVKKVIAISTDKAVNPINLYGASKLCADKLITASNFYSGNLGTTFSAVRCGNVLNSRGSIIPSLMEERTSGTVSVTDKRMTRFWITLDQFSNFVLDCLKIMKGGEIFIPKIPSMHVLDLVKIVAPNAKIRFVGMRWGEKLHEVLVPRDESTHTLEARDMYIIQTPYTYLKEYYRHNGKYKKVPDKFKYSSDTNSRWLTQEQLKKYLKIERIA